jgi:hypothetical protein
VFLRSLETTIVKFLRLVGEGRRVRKVSGREGTDALGCQDAIKVFRAPP